MDPTLADWLLAQLQSTSDAPDYMKLARALQQAIVSGRLAAGVRLPPSRSLGADLGIARNTVVRVYEQLVAEGYAAAHSGSGTYVADTVPKLDHRSASAKQSRRGAQRLSRRGVRTIELAGVGKNQWGSFMPGVPDVTEFPVKTWTRLQNRVWRHARPEMMTYAPGGGYMPLRRALADYLRVSRATNCQPDNVLVTTGIHQSLDVAIRLLCDIGDEVWVEDPCYWGTRNLLLSSGLVPVPIPVDGEGINPSVRHRSRPPRLIICTPSHQYPLGCVMSLARRRMLLEYVATHGCWIIEDDYDSEFRYGISPVSSLQGLDPQDNVIYVGSFSKVLFPSLRIGYMVVPDSMSDMFEQGIAELYREGQPMQQAVLTEFIGEGHVGTHIRRMRSLYADRRTALVRAIQNRYGERLPVVGSEAGLHLVLQLPDIRDDLAVSRAALGSGILTRALSTYYASLRAARSGLLLGYASTPENRMEGTFGKLADVIDTFDVCTS